MYHPNLNCGRKKNSLSQNDKEQYVGTEIKFPVSTKLTQWNESNVVGLNWNEDTKKNIHGGDYQSSPNDTLEKKNELGFSIAVCNDEEC